MLKQILGIAGLVWASQPGIALACAVCGDTEDDGSRLAYIAMTAMMTFIPFILVGGLGFYIWRKIRLQESTELVSDEVSGH